MIICKKLYLLATILNKNNLHTEIWFEVFQVIIWPQVPRWNLWKGMNETILSRSIGKYVALLFLTDVCNTGTPHRRLLHHGTQ